MSVTVKEFADHMAALQRVSGTPASVLVERWRLDFGMVERATPVTYSIEEWARACQRSQERSLARRGTPPSMTPLAWAFAFLIVLAVALSAMLVANFVPWALQ